MTSARTLFISDLHLSAERQDLQQAFEAFCRQKIRPGDRLFILGDLVDYWIGDDDDRPFAQQLAKQLTAVSDSGVELLFMRGNRDFLIGLDFCRRTGMQLLPDPCTLAWGEKTLLLTHGDLLCTLDVEYMQARRMLRSAQWIEQFTAQPLAARIDHLEQLRDRSTASKARRPEQLDAVPEAACQMLRAWRADILLHGHTHRPKLHWHEVDGRKLPRYVLSDWRPQANCLILDGDECRFQDLPAP